MLVIIGSGSWSENFMFDAGAYKAIMTAEAAAEPILEANSKQTPAVIWLEMQANLINAVSTCSSTLGANSVCIKPEIKTGPLLKILSFRTLYSQR